MNSKEKIQELLAQAGLTLNGANPWDPQVHDELLYDRIFSEGYIALGESYMDGWWDIEDLPEFICRAVRAHIDEHISPIVILPQIIRAKFFNRQNRRRAFEVVEKHYDLGNTLYERMLDPTMSYTCGYWKDAKTLEQAQINKLDLICRKIGLKPGERVLDIGCGWGGFAAFAAERYKAKIVGVTISKDQIEIARKRTQGLPVEIRFQDYRDTSDGPFDHIVSIGMFEHVGHKNYGTFMRKARELLKPEGLFLLHTIGAHREMRVPDPWLDKYIFPNGILPSIRQIGASTNRIFVLEDLHNFGADYEKTLLAWFKNFHESWGELSKMYDERFYRMWKFYLLSLAGGFRARHVHLWQMVFSPQGVLGGYRSVR